MRGIEDSIKELKDQIAKLDNLILMGEYYIHMVNSASIMKDIAESQALKRDLELMLHAAENICNRAAVYEDDEGDERNE